MYASASEKMMPPPPTKYANFRIWHHLQVFFKPPPSFFWHHLHVFLMEVVSKKKAQSWSNSKIFSNQMWQHLQVYFCWRRCKKSSNKKSQSSRAKCTSALAWSNSKIPEVIFLTPPTFFNGGGVKNLFNPNVQNFRNWHHLHVFSTSPPSFFDGGGVKKSSNKKSQSTRAKCTSALAWSVNFKFFSNPNVWNGTSWSLTTLDFFQAPSSKRD